MGFSVSLFAFSLLGLGALFGVKWHESRQDAVLLAKVRRSADIRASRAKKYLARVAEKGRRAPGITLLVMRYFVHVGAKAFARFASKAEEAAHSLADRVSHKHRHQRGESRSRFLKEVAEHKQGLRGDEPSTS